MTNKHSHYFKDVSHLQKLDVYRVLELFDVTDPCLQHAIKKLLVAGGRGAGKDIHKDIAEAIDSLTRWQAMRAEDIPQGVPAAISMLKNVTIKVPADGGNATFACGPGGAGGSPASATGGASSPAREWKQFAVTNPNEGEPREIWVDIKNNSGQPPTGYKWNLHSDWLRLDRLPDAPLPLPVPGGWWRYNRAL